MVAVFEKLQQEALVLGISLFDFNQMTLNDIQCIFVAEKQRLEREGQIKYQQSVVNAIVFSHIFNGKEPPSYQTLFQSENKREDWKLIKENMALIAMEINQKRKGGEEA